MTCHNHITKPDEYGFTLIEVLAALLVFTLGIVGLTHAGTQSAKGTTVLNEKMLASIVADNQLIAARRAAISQGMQRGEVEQMGHAFLFSVETTRINEGNLYQIKVDVSKKSPTDDTQIIVSRAAMQRLPRGAGA